MLATVLIAVIFSTVMHSTSRPAGDVTQEKLTGNRTMTCVGCFPENLKVTAMKDCDNAGKSFAEVSNEGRKIVYSCK